MSRDFKWALINFLLTDYAMSFYKVHIIHDQMFLFAILC